MNPKEFKWIPPNSLIFYVIFDRIFLVDIFGKKAKYYLSAVNVLYRWFTKKKKSVVFRFKAGDKLRIIKPSETIQRKKYF